MTRGDLCGDCGKSDRDSRNENVIVRFWIAQLGFLHDVNTRLCNKKHTKECSFVFSALTEFILKEVSTFVATLTYVTVLIQKTFLLV